MSIIKLPDKIDLTKNELDFFDKLSHYDQFLIFSPHLDDAVLSMGSLLVELGKLGKKIKVISIFTTSSKVESTLNRRLRNQANIEDPEQYFLTRIKEDKKAIALLGKISIDHLGFIDAAWRENGNGKALYPESTLGKIADNDDVYNIIEEKLKDYINLPNTAIFAPIARGEHVDHQITRDVVTKLFPKVYYYCDFPYSNLYPDKDLFADTHNLISVDWHGDNYQKKAESILIYQTQNTSNFKGKELQMPFERFYFQAN